MFNNRVTYCVVVDLNDKQHGYNTCFLWFSSFNYVSFDSFSNFLPVTVSLNACLALLQTNKMVS